MSFLWIFFFIFVYLLYIYICNMRRILGLAFAALMVCSCAHTPTWTLVWEENFDGNELDTTVWSRTKKGRADWANTQSDDPRLVEFRDGLLVLKGMVGDTIGDSITYITGGVLSRGKKNFNPIARVEVRARQHGAKGAWPALWMMGEGYQWPYGGEIDIMERLSYDSIFYQTVHSPYTLTHEGEKHGTTAPFNPDDFNVFGVQVMEDSITYFINGQQSYSYYRNAELPDSLHQYPFLVPNYILMDMQLGGNWVGEVDPNDLPVEMEIDWVREYNLK